ncbi:MAG: hypothetical protein ACFFAO_10935 [Candidatus Hermodarchaeota archaeon]
MTLIIKNQYEIKSPCTPNENQYHPRGIIRTKNYPSGQLAVYYQDTNGEPIAELSINEDSIQLDSDEIILKNYSENAKIAKDFLDSEILLPTERFVVIGAHLCPICKVCV